MKPAHKCPDWDYLLIKPGDPEMHCCWCAFNKGFSAYEADDLTDADMERCWQRLYDAASCDNDALKDAVRQLFGDLNVKPLYKKETDEPT